MKFQFLCFSLLVVAGCVGVSAQTTDDVAVVAAVAPVYPAIAAAAHAIGDVTIDVKIDASGNVTSAGPCSRPPTLAGCQRRSRSPLEIRAGEGIKSRPHSSADIYVS